MITITAPAAAKITEMIESKGLGEVALRVAIQGRGPGGFMYQLQFINLEDKTPEDSLVETEGLSVIIDPATAENMDGSTIDFVDEIAERGFKIDNPNPLWKDPLSIKVQDVIDNQINPAIASHGGFVMLLDVEDDKAFIQLGGGCVGCGMVDVTLKSGIEVMIKDSIPEIAHVIDTTDHASGQNPYYQPSKGGQSPHSKN